MHRKPSAPSPRRALSSLLLLCALLSFASPACAPPDDLDMLDGRSPRVRIFSNFTGTRTQNGLDPEIDNVIVQLIDLSKVRVDVAAMGFSRRPVLDALERAYLRGVTIRFVGDARHMESLNAGYMLMDFYNVPMTTGNQFHIMHNKFFIIDDRFVATGTGNITSSEFDRNNNNYIVIDSPPIAADFRAEFEQMLAGRFGNAKKFIDNGRLYQVGDTQVEVFFSPQEDAVGRLQQAIAEAQESVYFTIFAFTKDQVGAAFISKHREFTRYNACCDPSRDAERQADAELQSTCPVVACQQPFRSKEVRGVIDRSQLHSNGPFHELYRLLQFGVPMRLDGNDNSYLPGDYQAGGGRLHSKTLLIDPGTPTAKFITGSFNWSSAATTANDETLFALTGQRITDEMQPYFQTLWDMGKQLGNDYVGNPNGKVLPSRLDDSGQFIPGSVIFNEVHWDGYNGDIDTSDLGGDQVYNDEFIEILNTTDQPIDLTLWVIGSRDDFILGFYPGTIIGPYERFLILDHNLQPFVDTEPQDKPHAFANPDFVMNMANDARFLRLNLRNADLSLMLIDPRGHVIDVVGDSGPAFAGGRARTEDQTAIVNRSMERVHPPGPGDQPTSWVASPALRGGANVREPYRDIILATPGEPNAAGDIYPPENPSFRAPLAESP
jgi:phosphatidylserine/phosphatidylglycerophosphate/cardiolipin synthase-like enzyme